MNPWLSAAIGFVSFPAAYLAVALTPWHHLSLIPAEDRPSLRCLVCGYEAVGRSEATMRLDFTVRHNLLIRRRRWHRQALAVWRVEVGRDPLTGEVIRAATDTP